MMAVVGQELREGAEKMSKTNGSLNWCRMNGQVLLGRGGLGMTKKRGGHDHI
jgi:hypothetical protein